MNRRPGHGRIIVGRLAEASSERVGRMIEQQSS
jgi:hypothetical protein